MTGRPGHRTMEMNGTSTVSYLMRTPRVPFCHAYFNRSGSKEPFSFPGATWDRFRCTVEPSPGHIRCRKNAESSRERLEKTLGKPLPIPNHEVQVKFSEFFFLSAFVSPEFWGTSTRGVAERGVFVFAYQHIVSPRPWTSNHIVTQMLCPSPC